MRLWSRGFLNGCRGCVALNGCRGCGALNGCRGCVALQNGVMDKRKVN